jgi:UDP-glucose 4-epimerase
MKVFVTGGAGFLGSNVARVLLDAGHSVTVLDNLSSSGKREFVPAAATFIRGNVASARLPEWLTGHDAVIHLAAFVPVGPSVQRPVEYAENNVVNTVRLLEAMRKAGVPKIVFSSSATVYGLPKKLPLDEDAPLGLASNPYGASKVACEAFLAAYHQLHKLDVAILRYFNPFGPNEVCDPETHLIPNVVKAGLEDRPVPVYWGGEQVRDFIYVEDLARAHLDVLPLSGLNVFNVGSETGTKVKDVIRMVADILDKPLRIDDLGERPGDVPALYATSARLRKATGWQPRVSFEEGLRRTVAFYRGRMAAVEANGQTGKRASRKRA